MPTILRWEGYRAFFYSNEGGEPAHVHVRKGGAEAKFWLHDLSLAFAVGFSPGELASILTVVRARRDELTKAWDAYFSNRG